jgi:hypothetical protein
MWRYARQWGHSTHVNATREADRKLRFFRDARGTVWGILLLGAFLLIPAIRTPFFLDDYLQSAMVGGSFPVPRNPLNLYDFVDDEARPVLAARGLLPWWAHPHLTLRFLRPLSSALLYVDHSVFRGHPLPMHLHSLVWWVVAVLVVGALYKRTFRPRPALLATAIFALAPCHTMPVAWLANREAIVALAFGALALGAQARFRGALPGTEPRPRDAIKAAVLFALAFLGGGEYALCFGGYVLAMELVAARRRLIGLLPFAVPALGYLAVRAWLGYGAVGSGFYADPVKAPLAFLYSAPWRLVALVASGWLSVDAHTFVIGSPWVAIAGVVVAVAIVWVPVRRALAQLDPETKRTASWLALGSLFSLAPVLAVSPSPRVLGVATIGVASTMAVFLDAAWFPEKRPERRGVAELTQLVALALGFAHLVHGPMSGWLEARHIRGDATHFAERATWLRAELARRSVSAGEAEIGVVRGLAMTMFMPFAVDPQGRPPRMYRLLSHCGHVLVLRRDERTLELVVPRGRSLYPKAELSLWRSLDARMHPGDTIARPGMEVTITGVDDQGSPTRARIVLTDEAIHDALWFSEDFEAWREAELPRPGFGAPFDP